MSEKNNTEKQVVDENKLEKLLAGTEAGAIWNEIKDKAIEMFALPDQKISNHVFPSFVEPSKLYLMARATCALPAVEQALGNKFNVELMDRYIVVSRAVNPFRK